MLLLSTKFSFDLATSWREAKHLSGKTKPRAFAKSEIQPHAALALELLQWLEGQEQGKQEQQLKQNARSYTVIFTGNIIYFFW